ncbi:MAG: hypothetical protein GW936_08695 [Gallionella sp.]|nr:hypothetical protein [Gallionella sp.]
MNKVVYVRAFFIPIGKNVTVKVPTGEKTKGFFGGEKEVTETVERWEQTGWSKSEIDGDRLAKDIEKAIENLNSEGYEVVCMSEVISGQYNYDSYTGSSPGYAYGYGYGYSYTEGVTIIAKKSA